MQTLFQDNFPLGFWPLTAPRLSTCWLLAGFLFFAVFGIVRAENSGGVDLVIWGDQSSEQAHQVVAKDSEKIEGALQLPARRLLPPDSGDWKGGTLSFKMKVDPEKQNYFTAKFWGSEANPNRLILFCEGKQIGYRHLGDYDLLDIGDSAPPYTGRFYYNTSPLPLGMTKGKTEVALEIRSNGPIYGYGSSFEQYQKPMKEPSKALYRGYTHTSGCFVPALDEKQGEIPTNPPVRNAPGPEVIDDVKARLNREISGWLKSDKPLSQQEAQILGEAWHMNWTPAYQNKRVLEKIAQTADAFYEKFASDPKIAESEPGMYNAGWFGLGPLGDAIYQVGESIQPLLGERVKGKTRKEAWGEMLLASVDWHARNRRQYTNQSMITDLSIQWANDGLRAVDPSKAWPEAKTLRYLYESIGLEPWLGSETNQGPAKILGDHYFQLTEKGLTKELGYVGYYGEVLDWVTHIYDATCRPGQPGSGDPRVRERLAKMEHARQYFRYPMLDAEGNRAMRIETIIGWRDSHYPGDVCYAERAGWEGSPIYSVAATLDKQSIGAAQQMLEDNQFYVAVSDLLKQGGSRLSKALLPVPDQLQALQAQAKSPKRLPMTPGQPDFAWADEENGVVVLKNGGDMLYASLYWRSRYAVNSLARVHYITPLFDRIAVVHEECEIEDSGLVYKRPNWINHGFGNGGQSYPGDIQSAHEGEELPIAKIPADVPFKNGDENAYAGKALFYHLLYGRYLIGLNTTTDKTFSLKIPAEIQGQDVPDLISQKKIKVGGEVAVGPRSTVILDLGK